MDFNSSISGISNAVGPEADPKKNPGMASALCRQAQMGVFAKKAHAQLINSAQWLSMFGTPLWGGAKQDNVEYSIEA